MALRFGLIAFPAIFFVPRPDVRWLAVIAVGVFIGVGQFGLLFVAMNTGLPAGLASHRVKSQVSRENALVVQGWAEFTDQRFLYYSPAWRRCCYSPGGCPKCHGEAGAIGRSARHDQSVTSPALGPRALVRQVTERLGTAPDAAGLFFSVGSLKAAVLKENPILSGTAAETRAEEDASTQAMPRAVAMSVVGRSVLVFPAATTGQVTGDPILSLSAGQFSARTSKTAFTVVLTLGVNGTTLRFEAKRFPVGVNRHNDRIAELIASLRPTGA